MDLRSIRIPGSFSEYLDFRDSLGENLFLSFLEQVLPQVYEIPAKTWLAWCLTLLVPFTV